MKIANYSEFRANLKDYLDSVETENEIIFLKRGSGQGVALLSIEDYNSLMESMHLLSSRKNSERLQQSIDQMNSRDSEEKQQKKL